MEKCKIIVYSLIHCAYCVRAKALLDKYKLEYQEIFVEDLPQEEIDKLLDKTKMRTFPQIIINDKVIGGYNELNNLDSKVGIVAYCSKS